MKKKSPGDAGKADSWNPDFWLERFLIGRNQKGALTLLNCRICLTPKWQPLRRKMLWREPLPEKPRGALMAKQDRESPAERLRQFREMAAEARHCSRQSNRSGNARRLLVSCWCMGSADQGTREHGVQIGRNGVTSGGTRWRQAMDDAARKRRLPQTLSRTKAGKLLEDQARDVEEKKGREAARV